MRLKKREENDSSAEVEKGAVSPQQLSVCACVGALGQLHAAGELHPCGTHRASPGSGIFLAGFVLSCTKGNLG